jgi:hypothetical protein
LLAQIGVVEHVLGIAVEHDLCHIQNNGTVGQMQGCNGILLDNDRGSKCVLSRTFAGSSHP